jgi:CsoR family transcriptional regulator, copper-sensing transcriptional repressor
MKLRKNWRLITLDNNTEMHCHSDSSNRKSHHPEHIKKDLMNRLNRIEGQIRGIKGMVEKDVYCDDIITQLSASQSALNSVAKVLLQWHLKGCVVDRLTEGDEEVLDELIVTIQKLMKK